MKLQKTLEQAALLGTYPILALTATGFQALAGLLVVLAASIPAGLVSIWLRRSIPGSLVWLVNVAVAAGAAITTALLMPYLLPIPELSTHIMAIAGVTPIAFVFCRPMMKRAAGDSRTGNPAAVSPRNAERSASASGNQPGSGTSGTQSSDDDQPGATAVFTSFAAFVIVTTIFREVLGAGTLFGAGVTPGGAIPAGIMSTHSGGFMMLALILFAIRVYTLWDSRPARGSESTRAQTADGGTR